MRCAVLGAAVLSGLVGCGADTEQARYCARLIPAFEERSETVVELGRERSPRGDGESGVVIRYRFQARDGADSEHWIDCRFAGGPLGAGRLALISVATDRDGPLSPLSMQMLRIWLDVAGSQGFSPSRDPTGVAGPTLDHPSYLLQQLVNAAPVSCLYILLAVAYSLVYAVIGRINFAFGEMSTIGAYAAFFGVVLLGAMGGPPLAAALLAVMVFAVCVGAMYGLATERIVFRPLRGIGSQALLIATIGLAIALREFLRLSQGSRDRWLPPIVTDPHPIVADGTFTVAISTAQLAVLFVTVVLCGALLALMTRTDFGRRHRACSDDAGMAALLGVNVDRTVALTFALGSGLAAVAGTIITLYYGTVSAYMGLQIGFKALVAAIVGGIGSVAGAMLGGALIGVFETLWSAYLAGAYRDIAVFGLLAAVLVLRPTGILGTSAERGD